MKRYLISGALTLIAGLFLTSCHDKDMEYSYGASQKTQAYDQAFKETFGTPVAGHNWGFTVVEDNSSSAATTRALTRGHNKNSNQWASEGWVIPDKLTTEQKDKVRRYFQQNRNPQGISVNYTDFFVQQVYKGGSDLTGSLTQESYYYGNGDYVCGSSNMDKLTAGTMEDHINDFNYGDRGEINVQNNNLVGEHQDAITLMVNSQTNCFGFHNSRDSKQYNDQYVIIPGNVIDQWDTERTDISVTGMFFVGFDFEANKNAYDQNGNLSANSNMYLVTETTAADGVAVPNKNDGKLYHIGGADGYYSDWIVRITKGVKKDNSTVTTNTSQTSQEIPHGSTFRITKWEIKDRGRVFCEDLGGNYTTNREDFDFNDIVFDALVWQKQEFIWEDQAVQATDTDGNLLWEQEEVAKTDNDGHIIYSVNGVETTTPPSDWTPEQCAAAIVKITTDKLDENNQRIPVYEKDANNEYVYERVELTDYRGTPEYYAEIVILATGATIGCSVAGVEVHDAFGVGYTTMVNTVGGSSTAFGSYIDKTPVYIGELKRIESPTLDAIPITVLWNSGLDGATTLRTHKTAAGAAFMGAPQKFQVPIGTSWAQERVRIDRAYPGFITYISTPSYNWTTATGDDAPDALYMFEQNYPNIFNGKEDYEVSEVVDSDSYHTTSPDIVQGDPVNNNPSSGGTNEPTNNQDGNSGGTQTSNNLTPIATPASNEVKLFEDADGVNFGYYKKIHFTISQLEAKNINEGSIIRVYGWATNAEYELSVKDGNDSGLFTAVGAEQNTSKTFEKNGYLEFTITATALDNMSGNNGKPNGFCIVGNNFSLSYVTIDNSKVVVTDSSYGILWNEGRDIDDFTATLNMTRCKAGDKLTFNFTHTHDENNVGVIIVISLDGYSVKYRDGWNAVDNNLNSVTITLTDEQAKRLNLDKGVKISGTGLHLNSIVLEKP